MIGSIIYTLCALTAGACATLLLRAYQRSGSALLWWSGLCFALLTVNNTLVLVDLVMLGPEVSLFLLRNAAALVGLLLLLFGLIWRSE
jgi:hypothetical protein